MQVNQLIESKKFFEKWGVNITNLEQYHDYQKKLPEFLEQYQKLKEVYPEMSKFVEEYMKDKDLLDQVTVYRIAETTAIHTIEYKGYCGVIEVDIEEDMLCGRVIGIKDVITFKAETVKQAKIEFAKSVEDYLEFCQELNREPQ